MAGKLEVIRDMDSNQRLEVAQVCVESHCPLWSYIKKMGFCWRAVFAAGWNFEMHEGSWSKAW
jgi:hypothetical protein